LNPQGKPSLIALTHFVKEAASLLAPRAEGPLSHVETVQRDRQINELTSALDSLHERYIIALKHAPETVPQTRRELLAYSRDLVGEMQQMVTASLGATKGRTP
jgi:hypothetical protein